LASGTESKEDGRKEKGVNVIAGPNDGTEKRCTHVIKQY
jgi:hypothetical protein